ncbi:hypothetical protein EON65_34135 [archaeon]|nr:MAG: hypothetical protein EON65_34135 [archaeon]
MRKRKALEKSVKLEKSTKVFKMKNEQTGQYEHNASSNMPQATPNTESLAEMLLQLRQDHDGAVEPQSRHIESVNTPLARSNSHSEVKHSYPTFYTQILPYSFVYLEINNNRTETSGQHVRNMQL